MAQSILGVQMWTVRDFTKTPQGVAESLKKISKIGYKAVQVSGIGAAMDPKELRKMTDAEGLTIAATHVGFDKLVTDLPAMIDLHRAYGCENVAIGIMPDYARENAETVLAFARQAGEVGKKLVEAGFTFSYHQHGFEFRNLGGKRMIEILLDNSDPRHVKLEPDTYWIQYAGADPAAIIEKYKDRIVLLHLKDMDTPLDKYEGNLMAEVGEGNLNWPAILRSARAANVKWYLVEQDVCQRDPFESLAISHRNLKTMGIE